MNAFHNIILSCMREWDRRRLHIKPFAGSGPMTFLLVCVFVNNPNPEKAGMCWPMCMGLCVCLCVWVRECSPSSGIPVYSLYGSPLGFLVWKTARADVHYSQGRKGSGYNQQKALFYVFPWACVGPHCGTKLLTLQGWVVKHLVHLVCLCPLWKVSEELTADWFLTHN